MNSALLRAAVSGKSRWCIAACASALVANEFTFSLRTVCVKYSLVCRTNILVGSKYMTHTDDSDRLTDTVNKLLLVTTVKYWPATVASCFICRIYLLNLLRSNSVYCIARHWLEYFRIIQYNIVTSDTYVVLKFAPIRLVTWRSKSFYCIVFCILAVDSGVRDH